MQVNADKKKGTGKKVYAVVHHDKASLSRSIQPETAALKVNANVHAGMPPQG